MDQAQQAAILDQYPHATAFQRWHMRGRLHLCPYEALTPQLTGRDTLLDIGCGFGHLAWFLAGVRPDIRYFGVDVDERKIALAAGSVNGRASGGANAPGFRLGDASHPATLKGWPGRYGNIVLLDVLYLLPWEAQAALLEWALGRLDPAPGSALILKSMEQAEGIPGFRALAEEWIMVSLLRRTRSSGTIRGARPAADYAAFARERGWQSQVIDLGTYNPSYLIRIHR